MAKPNLHPCYCPWCRKDLGIVTDLGSSDRVYQCRGCQNYYTGAVWPGKCPVCGALSGHQIYIKTLAQDDRVPGDPCQDCVGKQAKMDQAVQDGGVRFQCVGCGSDGVFSSSTPFAQRVREETKKPAPQDVFVQIKTCPQCPKVDDPVPEQDDADLDNLVDDILSV